MSDADEVEQNLKKRQFVIKEIISTERTYLSRLQIMIEVYAQPLKATRVLDNSDIISQFDTLEKLYKLHLKFAVSDADADSLNIVELFNDVTNNFQIYSEYLVNYEPAMQRRGSLLTRNRKYSDFLEKAMKDPKCLNQSIESLLIMPVQRIPRYRLLLEQLLKYTPEDHAEYQVVRTALDKICDLAMFNNEAIRARENKTKIMAVMMQFEPRSRIDLLDDAHRQFIREGTLQRQCRRGLKEFHFWLFSDKLLYGQGLPLGDIFILNREISLSQCYAKLFDSIYNNDRTFMVESPAKSFIIHAKDETERNEWLRAIKDAIQKQQERLSTRTGVVAPLWIPDAISIQCQRCNAKFTLINRRHHCRNCGAIVCDTCSTRRHLVSHVNEKKEVRVCDPCHTELNRTVNVRTALGEVEAAVLLGGDELYESDEDDVDAGFVAAADRECTHRGTVSEEELDAFNEEYSVIAQKILLQQQRSSEAESAPGGRGGRGGGGRGQFALTKSVSMQNRITPAFSTASSSGAAEKSPMSTSPKSPVSPLSSAAAATAPGKRQSMFPGSAAVSSFFGSLTPPAMRSRGTTFVNSSTSNIGSSSSSSTSGAAVSTNSSIVNANSPPKPPRLPPHQSLQATAERSVTLPAVNDQASPVPVSASKTSETEQTTQMRSEWLSGGEVHGEREGSSADIARQQNAITLSLRRNQLFKAASEVADGATSDASPSADATASAATNNATAETAPVQPTSEIAEKPPAKPPKPLSGGRMPRRTNVCMRPEDMPVEMLLRAQEAEAKKEEEGDARSGAGNDSAAAAAAAATAL